MNSTSPVIVLVGPPGAGKTTIGRRLSRALNTTSADSDTLIEEATGKLCGDIFAELGEQQFRDIEEGFVAQALQTGGVVSLGGGAVLSASTRDLLSRLEVAWIDVSAEEGVKRTFNGQTRPVLQAEDPLAHFGNLLKARQRFYEEVASFRVRTTSRSPQQVVADILSYLENENQPDNSLFNLSS